MENTPFQILKKTRAKSFKNQLKFFLSLLFHLLFIFLDMKLLLEVVPCLLVIQIQIQIQAVCNRVEENDDVKNDEIDDNSN